MLTVWEEARTRWPGVDLCAGRFSDHVTDLGAMPPRIHATHWSDLYLACACHAGVPGAVETFDREFLAHVPRIVRRIDRSPVFADDVRQLLREKLLVGSQGRPPKIAEYDGRGSLLAWVRVAAQRTAFNLRRNQCGRHRAWSDSALQVSSGHDPELEIIESQHRGAFVSAITDALAQLPDEHRTAMRLIAEGQTTARIGDMLHVNQSTIVRWLASARACVRERTRAILAERLRLSAPECASLTARMARRIDVNVGLAC
jgi:RNA polymerase sigma-70 factor (ECF subfamily)